MNIEKYLDEIKQVCIELHINEIATVIDELRRLRDRGGRLFILGVGGSAANASHAVNDFRKICGIEAYAPTDNVAEYTARANDEGLDMTFNKWLLTSRLNENDAILVLSVGGGNLDTSLNLVRAIDTAKACGSRILGIVSRDGGYTKHEAHACIMVPIVNEDHITPHAEAFQAILWHMIVWALK